MNFTGSPAVQALKQLILGVFQLNETTTPYTLAFSGGKLSGYSFGYPQFDLGQATSAVDSLFAGIIEDATSANGTYVIDPNVTGSDRTIAEAQGGDIYNLIQLAEQRGGNSLNQSQVATINAALGSAYWIGRSTAKSGNYGRFQPSGGAGCVHG